ncbi:MAG TPA: cupin domain-containing protein [Terriglobales bacterium]|nr:cupin domain-containing protein [Terriglobales bacterium]
MAKSIPTLLILVGLATLPCRSQQAGPAPQPVPSHVVPLKEFPRNQRFETVSGDPAKSGALYVIRIHSEVGYIVMPHTHPEDEHITVVKGSWALGMGDRFNPDALETMEVGTYGSVPAKMAHFAFSRTEAIVQVHGIGPFATTWVTPLYALTLEGVLLSTSAADPGRPTSTFSPDCFDLKIGSHVTSTYGDGVVIGAECTPGHLTQYRIQAPNGEHFWAVREKLTTP